MIKFVLPEILPAGRVNRDRLRRAGNGSTDACAASRDATEVKGKVAQYSMTPRGAVDGLILADGTEAYLPPAPVDANRLRGPARGRGDDRGSENGRQPSRSRGLSDQRRERRGGQGGAARDASSARRRKSNQAAAS